MLCTVSFFLMLALLNGVCLCFFVISAQQPIGTCYEPLPRQVAEPLNFSTLKPNTTGQRR